MSPCYRDLRALRTWLDSWPGIGLVAVGMPRQGATICTSLSTMNEVGGLRSRRPGWDTQQGPT
jgi:hypothetical protein